MAKKLIDRKELRSIVLLFLIAFALRAAFACQIPDWEAPDEKAHYLYIQELHEEGALPVSGENRSYEAHQAPLLYLLLLPVFALSGGDLFLLRLCNALIGAGMVPVVFLAIRRSSFRGIAWAVTFLVAFLPTFAAMTSTLSNDGLAILFITGAIGICLVLYRAGLQPKDAFYCGVLAALGMMSKVNTFAVWPGLVLALLVGKANVGAERVKRVGVQQLCLNRHV